MYFNVLKEKISKTRYREMLAAAKNRREIIAAGLGRRDLLKMGLVTAAGSLKPIRGLSAQQQPATGSNSVCVAENEAASPPTRAFVEPLQILPIFQPVRSLNPAPTVEPNTAAGEQRTRPHQALTIFPPNKFYLVSQHTLQVRMHPDLPLQTVWAFHDSHGNTSFPSPTYVSRYGGANLVRNFNNLPPADQNGGFGLPSVSTHLHNGHTPSESDGFPCDFFDALTEMPFLGNFYDQHYPNVLAGILSDFPGTGDINESLSTLFYHDHRLDFTAQNSYKGLVGFYLLFNNLDTGDETTGFRLPSFPEFDIPLLLADKLFDPEDGKMFFDLFSLDGVLGDKFMVNGKIQPFFRVKPRRYRFRMVDTGPSRFYEFFLTDLNDLSAHNLFWVIANDGNLLPAPVHVESMRIGVAERTDVIIDFRPFAGKSIYLENRLNQVNGLGPVVGSECSLPEILPAGQGNLLLRFDVDSEFVPDESADPEDMKFYDLPKIVPPRITRSLGFDRLNGQWSINGQFIDCDTIRFAVQQNSVENWLLLNLTGDWTHPIHIHFEEHQILSRNGVPPPLAVERSRKDVSRLQPNERVQLFFRFRDFHGRYPLHCHNMVHEDHAMMGRWEIEPVGDNKLVP
jgi:FtsP/CotA-like multicopper oxidase with cupredoxin domain